MRSPSNEGLAMLTAYVVVGGLLVAYLAFSVTADFARYHRVLTAMANANVPESWLTTLATLKAAGALGLLVGIAVPLIGTTTAAISTTAAAIGTAAASASSCSSSAPSSPTCAPATLRSPLRPSSSCWPWPRWCWGWPPEPHHEESSRSKVGNAR
jgi:DoxX-like family